MGVVQSFKDYFVKAKPVQDWASTVDPGGQQFEGSLIKGFVPENIYKPPFGFPRPQNILLLRKLGKNAYIHSIVSTLQFEVSSTPWDIVVKEGRTENESETQNIREFFKNPNGNSESFSYLIRAAVKDILELDSGVWIKAFDAQGTFKQVMVRDGGTFVKNPDVHGYFGDRADIIPGYYFQFNPETGQYVFINYLTTAEDIKKVANQSAYYQYGWSAAGIPIPFGKREVIWFECNPQTNNVYGRSPLEVLGDVLYTLLYGAGYNLDFYLNNNMPDGMLQIIGANKDDIRATRERMEAGFREKDIFDNTRKKFFQVPITNVEAKFTPFTLTSKDMEVLAQQSWFWKIAMACFGVTPSEMGFTEDSNKATDQNQGAVFRRKAVTPLLNEIEYKINMCLMPELDPLGNYEFRFQFEDINQDILLMQLYKMKIDSGVMTSEMVAEELGVDLEALRKGKEEQRAREQEDLKLRASAAQPFGGQEAKALPKKDEHLEGLDDYFTQSAREVEKLLKVFAPGGDDGAGA
jgi:phage portal protein BeeE